MQDHAIYAEWTHRIWSLLSTLCRMSHCAQMRS
jgi:hypothetical protein